MRKVTAYISLITLVLLGCNGTHTNDPSPQATVLAHNNLFVGLTQASSDQSWKQFFEDRGALEVWKKLRSNMEIWRKKPRESKALHIEFRRLREPSISRDNQANEVAAGIIQYLSYHGQEIEILSLTGGGTGEASTGIALSKKLTSVPTNIGNLTNLKELYLKDHELKEVPSIIGNFGHLKKLNLHSNKLNQLPPAIGNLSKLEELNLEDNPITEFPTEIGNLIDLKVLKLNMKSFSREIAPFKFPASIGNLVNLEYLGLQNKKIKELDVNIAQLSALKELDICINNLLPLPARLEKRIVACSSNSSFYNHWFKKDQLTRTDVPELANIAYEAIPRSLFLLSARAVLDYGKQVSGSEWREIETSLPDEFKPDRISKKLNQESPLLQGKYIIYFTEIEDLQLPFYWNKPLYTKRDVTDMLQTLEDKELYLLSTDSIEELRKKCWFF